MRLRWVISLLIATAVAFSLAGGTLGYVAWHEGQGDSGICIFYRSAIENAPGSGGTTEGLGSLIESYDQTCR